MSDAPPARKSLRSVSRFEANLLRVLHALLQHAPVEPILPLLLKALPRPRCLGRTAVELIQDTLAKGCVHFLARRGWTRDRHLRGSTIFEGRLWQRLPPQELGLRFSKWSLEFLVQLVSSTLGSSLPRVQELSVGDRLLLCLTLDALRRTPLAEPLLKKWLPLYQDGLCRLAFLDELLESRQRYLIDWSPWLQDQGSAVMESLQGWLADHWTQTERRKEKISTPARMRDLGRTQERVFGEYLDALAGAQRWDLARCFLVAAHSLLQPPLTVNRWVRNLDVSAERMADRQPVYQAALAFLRQMERLQHRQQQSLDTGYFDEGYQASQLWMADWDRYEGDLLCQRARTVLRELDPLQ